MEYQTGICLSSNDFCKTKEIKKYVQISKRTGKLDRDALDWVNQDQKARGWTRPLDSCYSNSKSVLYHDCFHV